MLFICFASCACLASLRITLSFFFAGLAELSGASQLVNSTGGIPFPMKTGVLFKCQFATVSVEVTVMKKIF